MPLPSHRHEEMISVENFARRCGISRSFAYQLANRGLNEGGVRAVRYGCKKAIRIPATEVDRFKRARVLEEA